MCWLYICESFHLPVYGCLHCHRLTIKFISLFIIDYAQSAFSLVIVMIFPGKTLITFVGCPICTVFTCFRYFLILKHCQLYPCAKLMLSILIPALFRWSYLLLTIAVSSWLRDSSLCPLVMSCVHVCVYSELSLSLLLTLGFLTFPFW